MPRLQSPITRQIRAIRRSLTAAERSLRRLTRLVRRFARAPSRPATGRPRRKLRISAARRRTLKLQGAYMGHLRQLGARDKARVKALKVRKGFPAAIAMAKRLARGR